MRLRRSLQESVRWERKRIDDLHKQRDELAVKFERNLERIEQQIAEAEISIEESEIAIAALPEGPNDDEA